MHKKMHKAFLLPLALAASLFATSSHAVPVDLELVLLNDTSGSVDSTDFNLQRQGYEAAFRDSGIISSIESGAIGSIAVTLIDWSDGVSTAVGWTQISDSTSSNAFADAIAAAGRTLSSGTAMTNALNFGASLLTTDNGFEGTRNVIDISGDGSDSQACSFNDPSCEPLQDARDAALAGAVDTINALWIDDRNFFGDDPEDTINALDYGTTNVIGGPGAFQDIVQDFDGFTAAISSKIQREITPPTTVPVPATLVLFLLGLGMLAFARRGRAG